MIEMQRQLERMVEILDTDAEHAVAWLSDPDFAASGGGELTTCDAAMFYFRQCGLTWLDGDSDGIPCESLCR